jgi:hypothetical protein
MQIEQIKVSIVAAWVLVLAAIAMSLSIESAAGWLLLVGMGLLTPMIIFRIWQPPVQTMSESIREVLK